MFKLVQRNTCYKIWRQCANHIVTKQNHRLVTLSLNRFACSPKRLYSTEVQQQQVQQTQHQTSALAVTPVNYELNKEHRLLHMTWSSGENTVHPLTWLRDNCRCNSCFNSSTLSRKLQLYTFDIHPQVQNVEVRILNN